MRIIILLVITLAVAFFFLRLMQMKKELSPKTEADKSVFEKNRQKLEEKKQQLQEDPLNLTNGKLLLRPLTPLDRKPLSVIFSDRDAATAVGIEPVKKYGQFLPYFNEELSDTIGAYGITILSSNRLVGLATFLPDGKDYDVNVVIESLSRNHGFGTQALDILKGEAKKSGAVLKRRTRSENEEPFLIKNGFNKEDTTFVYKGEQDEQLS